MILSLTCFCPLLKNLQSNHKSHSKLSYNKVVILFLSDKSNGSLIFSSEISTDSLGCWVGRRDENKSGE